MGEIFIATPFPIQSILKSCYFFLKYLTLLQKARLKTPTLLRSSNKQEGMMTSKRVKIHYEGSLFWLIFWLIFFFPIAFTLLFTSSNFDWNEKTYLLRYDGSRFWLCFWVLFFFPVAFFLLFLNGYSVTIQDQTP